MVVARKVRRTSGGFINAAPEAQNHGDGTVASTKLNVERSRDTLVEDAEGAHFQIRA